MNIGKARFQERVVVGKARGVWMMEPRPFLGDGARGRTLRQGRIGKARAVQTGRKRECWAAQPKPWEERKKKSWTMSRQISLGGRTLGEGSFVQGQGLLGGGPWEPGGASRGLRTSTVARKLVLGA